MENFYFIGVDVSKKKLDFCVMFEGKVVHEEEAANHQSAIMSLLRHMACVREGLALPAPDIESNDPLEYIKAR
jgi:hypothetical protein